MKKEAEEFRSLNYVFKQRLSRVSSGWENQVIIMGRRPQAARVEASKDSLKPLKPRITTNDKTARLKLRPSATNVSKQFFDEKGAVHFFIAEDSKKRNLEKLEADFYHPFITQVRE